VETVKSRLAEYVALQNPSRKIRTLEYGTRRRWGAGRALKWTALAGVSVALGWLLIFGVVSQ
jgi:hypothetical protein